MTVADKIRQMNDYDLACMLWVMGNLTPIGNTTVERVDNIMAFLQEECDKDLKTLIN